MQNVRKDHLISTNRELSTLASGLGVSEMDKVNKYGLMAHSIMAHGKIIKRKDEENSYILMATSMMANGSTIKQMDMAFMCM